MEERVVYERDIAVLLYNVRSAHNVGAILRTADAAGVKEVILTGYTPAPLDRFGRARKDIAKAALGAENFVSWQSITDAVEYICAAQKDGVEIVVLEQAPSSIPYTEYRPTSDILLVVGNEIDGVPQEIIDVADVCIEIPMSGTKESLNVSVATGIALFALRDT